MMLTKWGSPVTGVNWNKDGVTYMIHGSGQFNNAWSWNWIDAAPDIKIGRKPGLSERVERVLRQVKK